MMQPPTLKRLQKGPDRPFHTLKNRGVAGMVRNVVHAGGSSKPKWAETAAQT